MPIQSSQEWEQGGSDSNQNIRMLPAGLDLGTEEGKSIQAEYRTEGSKTIQTAEKHRLLCCPTEWEMGSLVVGSKHQEFTSKVSRFNGHGKILPTVMFII